MPYGDDFLPMLNVIVTLEAYLGQTGSGGRSYDTLRYYRCYIDRTGTLIRNAQGQQIVDSASVFLHPLETNSDGSAKTGAVRLTAIHDDSRIGIPDPTQPGGMAYPVLLKVEALMDETGSVQLFVIHC